MAGVILYCDIQQARLMMCGDNICPPRPRPIGNQDYILLYIHTYTLKQTQKKQTRNRKGNDKKQAPENTTRKARALVAAVRDFRMYAKQTNNQ